MNLNLSVRKVLKNLKPNIETAEFLKLKSSSGKYFFKLIFEGKHFATSRKYTTELRLQKGIREIVLYGSKAEILDFSDGDIVFENYSFFIKSYLNQQIYY